MTNPFDTDNLPVTEPESIVKGKYIAWRRELDYDDPIKYEFTSIDASHICLTLNGTQDGDYWIFEATGAATGAMTHSGLHLWELIYVRDSDDEELVMERGYINVFESDGDRRTHAEIMVEKIESLLNGRADADVDSYSIGSRSITKMSFKELTEWREYYLAEIGRSGGSTLNGTPKKNTVKARFID